MSAPLPYRESYRRRSQLPIGSNDSPSTIIPGLLFTTVFYTRYRIAKKKYAETRAELTKNRSQGSQRSNA